MEKNWALSVDQRWVQVLQFSVYLISLLSILLRCTDFARIQKALVNQMGSKSPNSGRDLFLVQVWLWKCFGVLGSTTKPVVAGCCIKSIFHHISQSFFRVYLFLIEG